MGATYTLDDLDSPDLRAVVLNIAKVRNAAPRRDRASALLGSLGRAWDRLAASAEVIAAQDFHSWEAKGATRAVWLWSVGAVAWLDDTDGDPHAPLDLRLRTAGTIAVHGPDAAGYLHQEFDSPNRREVLAALGVSGEPGTRDLVARLRSLRDGEGLVHTEFGWRTPAKVLLGLPVSRGRRAFVPQVPRSERLWTALRIRQPSVDDCMRIIGQVTDSSAS